MIFERADQQDAKQLISLFRLLEEEGAKVSFEPVEETKMKELLEEKQCFWYVARERESVVAVFRATRGKTGREHGVMMTSAVSKAYRGQHIAEELTAYALNDLKKIGIEIAYAYVYSNNKPSLSTLLNLGFHISGSVPMHHYEEEIQRYVDDLILYKIL